MTLAPSDMICFALYSATHAMQQAYRPLLDDIGITYPQFLVLSTLWTAKKPMTVSGIGDVLHLDSSTVTPLLKRLEAAGLVTRIRDPKDERQVKVSLSEAGRALEAQTAHVSTCILKKTGMDFSALAHLQADITALGERLRINSKPEKLRASPSNSV